MTGSFIAIKGIDQDKATAVFKSLKYIDLKKDKYFKNWETFNGYLLHNYF